MPTIPNMTKVIDIIRTGNDVEIFIDGVVFPYLHAQDGLTVDITTGTWPTVTITLMADTVTVHNAIGRNRA